MKQFSLKTIIVLLLLTQAASALAYVVKGTVVDATGKPLDKALVLGRNKAGTKILIYRKQKGPNTKIIKRDTLDRAQLPGCLKTDGARQVKPSPHNG